MSANSEAKEALMHSCIKFLKTKSPDKIFITDLVKDCHLNRNTFYYHFTGIPQLLSAVIFRQIKTVVDKYPTLPDLASCLDSLAGHSLEYKDVILNIFQSENRKVYEDLLFQVCEYIATKYAGDFFSRHSDYSDEDKELLIHFYTCEGFGQFMEWINSDMSFDPMERIRKYMQMYKKLIVE